LDRRLERPHSRFGRGDGDKTVFAGHLTQIIQPVARHNTVSLLRLISIVDGNKKEIKLAMIIAMIMIKTRQHEAHSIHIPTYFVSCQ
jgi:hypothetical protein